MEFVKKLRNFIFGRRFIINVLLIGTFWIILVIGTVFYFKSYTHHGEQVTVPILITHNIKDVPEIIGKSDLNYEIVDSIYNPDFLPGTIIYQDPKPTDSTGTNVKKGRVIRLRVSKNTRLVVIPKVVSRSERFATAVLASKGLRTRITYVPSLEDQGGVISQKYKGKDIEPGTSIPINSIIELTVGKREARNKVLVPNLIGLTINDAEKRLEELQGLKLFSICSSCTTAADSLNAVIYEQTPSAEDDNEILEGATITVFMTINREDIEE